MANITDKKYEIDITRPPVVVVQVILVTFEFF